MNEKFIKDLESKGFHVMYKKARTKYWYTIFDSKFKLLYRFPKPSKFKGEVEFIGGCYHHDYIILPEIIQAFDKGSYEYIDFIRDALDICGDMDYQYGIIVSYGHYEIGGTRIRHSIRKDDKDEIYISRYSTCRKRNSNKFLLDSLCRKRLYRRDEKFILPDEEFVGSMEKFNTASIHLNNELGSSIYVITNTYNWALCKNINLYKKEDTGEYVYRYKILDVLFRQPQSQILPIIDNLKIGDIVDITKHLDINLLNN